MEEVWFYVLSTTCNSAFTQTRKALQCYMTPCPQKISDCLWPPWFVAMQPAEYAVVGALLNLMERRVKEGEWGTRGQEVNYCSADLWPPSYPRIRSWNERKCFTHSKYFCLISETFFWPVKAKNCNLFWHSCSATYGRENLNCLKIRREIFW